jgi:maleate isomerase
MTVYGWRGRVGYIAPAVVYDLAGVDFYRIFPEGVMVVATTLGLQGLDDAAALESALANVERCARALADFHADIICLGGNPTGAALGPEGEEDLVRRMERAANRPAITVPRSAVQALRHLGVERVAIGSPIGQPHNQRLAAYLEAHGLQVTSIYGMGVSHEGLRLLDRSASYRAAKEAVRNGPRPDGVYLPVATWPTLDNIRPLEEDLGLPVVSSITAQAWNCARLLDVRIRRPEFGRLLSGA